MTNAHHHLTIAEDCAKCAALADADAAFWEPRDSTLARRHREAAAYERTRAAYHRRLAADLAPPAEGNGGAPAEAGAQ